MRIEFTKTLRVLAHELRGPVGIVQGYIRMLRLRRTDEADQRMLQAMMEATGRIATLGAHASELAQWYEGPPGREAVQIPLREMLDRASQLATVPAGVRILCDERTGHHSVQSPDIGALAAAVAAILHAAGRERPDAPVLVEAGLLPGDESVQVTIGTVAPTVDPDAASDHPAFSDARQVSFDQGGHGLALVLASCVLSTHGARLQSEAGAPGPLRLRIPVEGVGQ